MYSWLIGAVSLKEKLNSCLVQEPEFSGWFRFGQVRWHSGSAVDQAPTAHTGDTDRKSSETVKWMCSLR